MANKQIKQTDYRMSSLEIIGSGEGVKLKFQQKEEDANSIFWVEYQVKNPIPPHPDLVNTLNKLRKTIVRMFGFIHPDLVKSDDVMDEHEKEMYQEIINQVEITGLKLTGADENVNVEISFTKKLVGGKRISITCPKISKDFEDMDIDGEETLAVIVAELQNMTYRYQFKGWALQAQLDFTKTDAA